MCCRRAWCYGNRAASCVSCTEAGAIKHQLHSPRVPLKEPLSFQTSWNHSSCFCVNAGWSSSRKFPCKVRFLRLHASKWCHLKLKISLKTPPLLRVEHPHTYFCILDLLMVLLPYLASCHETQGTKCVCQRSENNRHILPFIYQGASGFASLHFWGLISGTMVGVCRQIAISSY